MADPVSWVVGIAAVIGAGAAVISAQQQRRAAKKALAEQRKQNDLSNRFESVRRQREIRQLIAQQRVQAASLEQAGVTSGIAGSSIVQGVTGAAATDTATALGQANAQAGAQYGISQSQSREAGFRLDATTANRYTYISQVANAVSSVGAGGWKSLGGLFGSFTFGSGGGAPTAGTSLARNTPQGV